jgi:hypothetical protein
VPDTAASTAFWIVGKSHPTGQTVTDGGGVLADAPAAIRIIGNVATFISEISSGTVSPMSR